MADVTAKSKPSPAALRIASGRSWITANWHLFLPVAMFALLGLWFITYGNANLFPREPSTRLESVYDGLAERLAQGRFDIPPDAIQGEAFQIDGRTYTYFPPTPALPRLVLNRIWPSMYGRWAKVFSLFFALATLLGTVALYRAWRDCRGSTPAGSRDRWLDLLLVVCAGFGSTTLFLTSKAIVYHEAPAWSVGLAIWAIVFVVRFWTTGRQRDLVAAGSLAFLSFFARGSSALGVLALLAATAVLAFPRARRAAAVAVGMLAITAGTYLWYNWVRWGDPFDTQPLRYNIAYQGARIEHIHGKIFNIAAVPRNFLNYWVAPTVKSSPLFPWVRYGVTWLGETPAIPYAYFDVHASVAAASSGLLILFAAGAVVALRMLRRDAKAFILIGCLFAGTIPLLAYLAICHRYMHDLYPALAGGACVALVAMRETGRRSFVLSMLALSLVSLYSAFVMFGLAWVFQRDVMWAMPEARRSQLSRISAGINEVFASSRFAAVDADCLPRVEPDGGRLRVFDCPAKAWRSAPQPFKAKLEVEIPLTLLGLREPLVTIGEPPSSELIFLGFESETEVRIGHEHWGESAVVSDGIKARPGDRLEIAILLDSAHDEVHVRVNEVEVLSRRRRLHDWGDGPPVFGANSWGGGVRGQFTGKLTVKPD